MQVSGKVFVTLYLTGILSISLLTLSAQNQPTVLESLQAKKWEIQGMTDKTAETHYHADPASRKINSFQTIPIL